MGFFGEELGKPKTKRLLAEFNVDNHAYEYLANVCFMDFDYYIMEKGYFKDANSNDSELIKYFDWVRTPYS